ncbi:hypothetical protein C8255_16600 [filamentous cyanobacterium CCP3]|nr:hypothetical protein C8255_16600 [filamentous cyanobacterium CCP3]
MIWTCVYQVAASGEGKQTGLGTFGGVYTPSILTILGVIMCNGCKRGLRRYRQRCLCWPPPGLNLLRCWQKSSDRQVNLAL